MAQEIKMSAAGLKAMQEELEYLSRKFNYLYLPFVIWSMPNL